MFVGMGGAALAGGRGLAPGCVGGGGNPPVEANDDAAAATAIRHRARVRSDLCIATKVFAN